MALQIFTKFPLSPLFVALADVHSSTPYSLAQAELHLPLATVFRRFDTELFETTRKDVDPKHDFFIPTPDLDSKGVRVMVR